MIATQNQQTQPNANLTDTIKERDIDLHSPTENNITTLKPLLLANRVVTHSTHAGLNPLVDSAGYLFSLIGKFKQTDSFQDLPKLQQELLQEITIFLDTIKNLGYNPEHQMACHYILAATLDDIITHTAWGGQGLWKNYSLLASINAETPQVDKFFTILTHALKEPSIYIDLLEFMYLCLSFGYKGQFRSTEYNQYQLDQITNNLYKHIQKHRGPFNRSLTITTPKTCKTSHALKEKSKIKGQTSMPFIFFVTVCLIMTIFIILGYLMDVLANEAYKAVFNTPHAISHQISTH